MVLVIAWLIINHASVWESTSQIVKQQSCIMWPSLNLQYCSLICTFSSINTENHLNLSYDPSGSHPVSANICYSKTASIVTPFSLQWKIDASITHCCYQQLILAIGASSYELAHAIIHSRYEEDK